MGVSYYVKLGPYVECPNPVRTIPREYHACGNEKCNKHKKETADVFCPQCGEKVKKLTKNSQKRLSFDVYEEFKDTMYDVHPERLPQEKQNSAIFLPNQGDFGQTFGDYAEVVLELNETVMLDEVARFKAAFEKEINRLQAVFGKAEVKWGVVAYAS
jgi:uncharacterized Zn finger protein (UPF0148 family)